MKTDLGLTVPAQIGMSVKDVETPALIVDLDAFERNLRKMRAIAQKHGVGLRAHAKAHKTAGIAHRQMEIGGVHGFCCQKVSEAVALIEEGITDILISNQVVAPAKIARLIDLAKHVTVRVCVDDARNVADLSEAAVAGGVKLGCLVEVDVGAGRCGVNPGADAARLAQEVSNAPGLRFDGLQAYNGSAQHCVDATRRQAMYDSVEAKVRTTLDALGELGLACAIISGAGTGTFRKEAASGVFTELQAGTYALMDASYMTVLNADGEQEVPFENAMFLLCTIMSAARPGIVICDGGHKSHAVDSGLPKLVDVDGAEYVGCNDEHGMIRDPKGQLDLHDRIRLIPGHCDPTCNLHDYIVGIRDDVVETVWPVTARGKLW
ncbi:DSD1 family PLP-dependent enzyme [Marinovum sp. 2_MG-2023]|uniref:DSD1 family PLP-dependent enzyme n=1 Tax=unclassified Marinovum TaxID=2647166 RepID=UPI0026E2CA0E|nr:MULTISPECIES: DSD1 family PLP-dependent enzyme [unclassified Marinovum]MDO6732894.1 DSD1 family PLP-dependent enzyme [Marinovum sp. 2_MG-2023]MDO6782176.1 DSD1 family PLP-dependent enzyme [Marinovum sp. 1_MG-2023]